MIPIICRSCQGNRQVHLQFYLQIKTLVEIERQSCYVNGFSNYSSTLSGMSFHGLLSKCKGPSIRKKIVVIITVNRGSFRKYVCRAGGRGVLKKRTKTDKGEGDGGGSNLSVRSLCEKNWLLFEQQAEFFLIGCLAVPKCVLF